MCDSLYVCQVAVVRVPGLDELSAFARRRWRSRTLDRDEEQEADHGGSEPDDVHEGNVAVRLEPEKPVTLVPRLAAQKNIDI
jgi:hypothetical protein